MPRHDPASARCRARLRDAARELARQDSLLRRTLAELVLDDPRSSELSAVLLGALGAEGRPGASLRPRHGSFPASGWRVP